MNAKDFFRSIYSDDDYTFCFSDKDMIEFAEAYINHLNKNSESGINDSICSKKLSFYKRERAILKLEFDVASDIKAAFTEAIRIAKNIDCCTEFDFNGVTCLAHPEGLAEKGVAMYQSLINSSSKYHIAFT